MNNSQVKNWPHFSTGMKFLVSGKLLDEIGRGELPAAERFNLRWDEAAKTLESSEETSMMATQFALEFAARSVYRRPIPDAVQQLASPLPPELLAAIHLGFAELLDAVPIPDEEHENGFYNMALALYAYLSRELVEHKRRDLSDGEKLEELVQDVRKAIATRFPRYSEEALEVIAELAKKRLGDSE